ncbi:integrase [Streptococcus phage Javan425]|uniref:Site-specific recombinase, phage integrase family n=1 Tax=Streptococcus porcinus str. Jelinkova 176 TaxID=873448 RepID=A0ABP2KY05_STRPO|nr:tyrosine-type recombinase/integrase [Streptococcus porcinus]EGJ26888.1 site-specific recombinase, phage integrase family [Streptococcus porcinus str. Jelinkova 176]QBX18347.1 integrase [Streptococcus phage Javan423]QBX18463.1 integrase [Streptococcus phage Javan425]SQG43919.1 integrase family protein [Streptococcus porcinus]
MASIRKRSNGWEFRISYKDSNGNYKQKTGGGFRTKREAEIKASEEKLRISKGITGDINSTLYDYFKIWSNTYKKNNVSLVTWKKYEYTLSKIRIYFRDAKIKNISVSQYQSAINQFLEDYSWRTVKMFNTHIRQCLKVAMHENIVQKDFTTFTKIAQNEKDEEKDILQIDEYFDLLETTSTIKYRSHFFIYLVAVTGLRFSEAMGLTVNDINFENSTININKTFKVYGPKRGYGPTKNKSSMRIVPIDDRTLSLLSEYVKRFEIKDRVFVELSNTAVNKTLKKLVGRNVHMHSLRHTYVSYLIKNNINVVQVSKLIGHTNPNTTLTVYSHLFKQQEIESVNQINNLFRSNLGQKTKKA